LDVKLCKNTRRRIKGKLKKINALQGAHFLLILKKCFFMTKTKKGQKTPTHIQGIDKTPAERGKEAIRAGKLAANEQPDDPAVREAEKKDAEKWRNEG
jgi:hypothetical protein